MVKICSLVQLAVLSLCVCAVCFDLIVAQTNVFKSKESSGFACVSSCVSDGLMIALTLVFSLSTTR